VVKVPDGMVLEQSPEQAAGGPGSQKGDIFNAGLVLYVLLTGEHPLLRETEEETREAVVACALPPPSTLDNLSSSLDAVVMRAVAKDPADRYPDMRSMQAALEEALATPGMGATAAEVGALVDALAPKREENLERSMGGVDLDEVMRVAEALEERIRGADARGLEATAALRAIDLRAPRPKVEVDCYFVDDAQAPTACRGHGCRRTSG
jgi:hypothetical protein